MIIMQIRQLLYEVDVSVIFVYQNHSLHGWFWIYNKVHTPNGEWTLSITSNINYLISGKLAAATD